MNKLILSSILSLAVFTSVFAGTSDLKEIALAPKGTSAMSDWAVQISSGTQFGNVRSDSLDTYTTVPINLTAAYKLDDVSNSGILAGYTEFLFQGYDTVVVHGPESHIRGVNFGPRYNFIQPNWVVTPYIQGLVGIGFADSNPTGTNRNNVRGLGQDFNFTFGVGAGIKYDISDRYFTTIGASYTHFSNAGLSEGKKGHPNRAADLLGPEIGFGAYF